MKMMGVHIILQYRATFTYYHARMIIPQRLLDNALLTRHELKLSIC